MKGKGRGKGGQAAKPAAEAPAPAGAYDEHKAKDGIVNAAVFRAGLRQWAKAEAATRAYLEALPKGPDAPRMLLSLADLHAKQGQTAKQLQELEEYQRRHAKDPDEWLGLQQRLAQLFEKAGNGPAARRAHAQGLEYWRRNKDKVKERGLALVARALYEELESGVRRVRPDLAQRGAQVPQGPARGEGEEAEEARGLVRAGGAAQAGGARRVRPLQDRPRVQALRADPLRRADPKEIRGDRALVEEYKSLLSQQAEPLEAKAIDGLALAVNAARDYGVVNELRQAGDRDPGEAQARRVRPVPRGPPRHRRVRAGQSARGYGLLAEVEGVPVRAAGARRSDPTLPPLRVRTTGGHEEPGPGGEPATLNPQRRVIRDEPVPTKQKRKKKSSTDDDEDLLP